jgi:hypothetical protein
MCIDLGPRALAVLVRGVDHDSSVPVAYFSHRFGYPVPADGEDDDVGPSHLSDGSCRCVGAELTENVFE